jgi:hypothetical protein
MTYKTGINLLIKDYKFRKLVTSILQKIKGTYMWKLTAINRKLDYNRTDKYFKFVTIPSHFHHKHQDSTRFNNKMIKVNKISKNFVFFKSPSGNGLLVPLNIEPNNNHTYTHFSNFIKYGKPSQIDEFWKVFGILVNKYFSKMNSNKTLYINTHGHDVPYLHVRFDIKPDKIVWN